MVFNYNTIKKFIHPHKTQEDEQENNKGLWGS